MKQQDKLFEEFIREKELKEERKLGRKRVVGVMHFLRFWSDEHIPFYKELLLWGYKKGKNKK